MAEKWVETSVGGFEEWAGKHGGADLHGARILLELADLNTTGELDAELLRELLLEDFPENVMAGAEDAAGVIGTAGQLVDFFAERGELDASRAAELKAVLAGIQPEFEAALEAQDDEGAAEFLARMMRAEGVDLDDDTAVQEWVQSFEALSDEEKLERTMQHFAAENVVPPVRLLPIPELAAAARESGLLRDALGLGAFVAGRDLDDDQLSGEDVEAAAAQLGIPTPRAVDGEIPEIERLLDALSDNELIEVENGTATFNEPELTDDEAALQAWVSLFDSVVTSEFEEGEALSPVEVVQSELPSVLLHMYEHGGTTGLGELIVDLLEHIQESYDIADGGALAQGVPESLRLELEDLERWGVVFLDEAQAGLTPLGVFAVRELLLAEGYTAPLIGDLAEGTAEELIAGLAYHREDTAEEEIGLWLSQRTPDEAASGLLSIMEGDSPSGRNLAAVVLQQVGQEAEPLIRAALDKPQTRPYAAIWLRGHGDEKIEPSEADMQWMFVDTVAGMLEAVGPHDAVQMALADTPPDADLTSLIEDLWRLDHPDAADVLEAIGDHHHDKALAKLARKTAFKARSK